VVAGTPGPQDLFPAMRRQLLEAVGRKLNLLLHQASAD
jgi:hypothetical protein